MLENSPLDKFVPSKEYSLPERHRNVYLKYLRYQQYPPRPPSGQPPRVILKLSWWLGNMLVNHGEKLLRYAG
jgi:hypothetical protein